MEDLLKIAAHFAPQAAELLKEGAEYVWDAIIDAINS